MTEKVDLRYQRVSDARRFYGILTNPNFTYFPVRLDSIEAEKDFLRQNREKMKKKLEFNYTILYNGKLVGGCGARIDQFRKYIGELGYFLDEAYWGMGITTQALKLLENIAFEELNIKRIEIQMHPENLASERVAIKCGYLKEGTKRKALQDGDDFFDCHLYAKTKSEN